MIDIVKIFIAVVLAEVTLRFLVDKNTPGIAVEFIKGAAKKLKKKTVFISPQEKQKKEQFLNNL